MTNIITSEWQHIESLHRHGAQIIGSDGSRVDLDIDFVNSIISKCIHDKCLGISFDMAFPGIADPMAIAIWKDGHIDSGEKSTIEMLMWTSRQID